MMRAHTGRGSTNSGRTTAAGGAGSESGEGRADGGFVRLGVGVDEEEDVACGDTRAGIADGGDQAKLDAKCAGIQLAGDFCRRIGGGVIDDDYFVGLHDILHRRMDTAEAVTDPSLFVMCRDNEGEHGAGMRDPDVIYEVPTKP